MIRQRAQVDALKQFLGNGPLRVPGGHRPKKLLAQWAVQQSRKEGCLWGRLTRNQLTCVVEHHGSAINWTDDAESRWLVKPRNPHLVGRKGIAADPENGEWGLIAIDGGPPPALPNPDSSVPSVSATDGPSDHCRIARCIERMQKRCPGALTSLQNPSILGPTMNGVLTITAVPCIIGPMTKQTNTRACVYCGD